LHLNEMGNKIAGEAIADELIKKGLVQRQILYSKRP
jgi:hypothetical protein